MTSQIPAYIEWPIWTLMGLTLTFVAGYETFKGAVDRWLTHRERMRAIEVDDLVAKSIEAYANEVKAKLDEMVIDVTHRTNSEVG